MLKFVTTGADGKKSLWIGLSQHNLDRLPEDPIMFSMAELDDAHPDRVVIVAGPTEEAIADRLRRMGMPIPEFPQPESGQRFEHRG